MREPEKAFELVRSARAAWDKSLSAKIRLGAEEDYDRLADFVEASPRRAADYVAITRGSRGRNSGGRGRWDFVARLAAEMPIPIVGNGDIGAGATTSAGATRPRAPAS
jgi:tRNA-dihydrouridine synthase B